MHKINGFKSSLHKKLECKITLSPDKRELKVSTPLNTITSDFRKSTNWCTKGAWRKRIKIDAEDGSILPQRFPEL